MQFTRAFGMKRLLAALVAALAVAASGQAHLAEADPANPFAVGDFDFLNTCGPTPILSLSIANHGSVPSSQYTIFRDVTLFVAYKKPDGTFYPPASAPVPTIAAGSEQTIKVAVLAADTTYTIAVKATSVATQQIIPLLRGTVITPSRTICAPAASSKPVVVQPKGGAPAPAPAVGKAPYWAKQCPGNTRCSYAALNTARLNMVDRTQLNPGGNSVLKAIGNVTDLFCSNACYFVRSWAGKSRAHTASSDATRTIFSYGVPLAGYVHDNERHTLGDDAWNEYLRTAFSFDLSSIPKGRTIWYATLVLKAQRTMLNYKPSNGTTCGTQIATLNYPWWNNVLDPLDKANYSAAIGLNPGSSPQVSLDITPLARVWAANPSTNFGLVLRGDPSEENMSAFLQNSCVTQYNFIQLQVQYAS